jgi:hypothetical protein
MLLDVAVPAAHRQLCLLCFANVELQLLVLVCQEL